jgi:hypothetical protein
VQQYFKYTKHQRITCISPPLGGLGGKKQGAKSRRLGGKKQGTESRRLRGKKARSSKYDFSSCLQYIRNGTIEGINEFLPYFCHIKQIHDAEQPIHF